MQCTSIIFVYSINSCTSNRIANIIYSFGLHTCCHLLSSSTFFLCCTIELQNKWNYVCKKMHAYAYAKLSNWKKKRVFLKMHVNCMRRLNFKIENNTCYYQNKWFYCVIWVKFMKSWIRLTTAYDLFWTKMKKRAASHM